MEFLALITAFENILSISLKLELLEQHYTPYSFGSGFVAYRINGRNLKLVFNGKDNYTECFLSKPHVKYSNVKDWSMVYSGNTNHLLNSKFAEVLNALKT